MREIVLTRGQIVMVDDEDYDHLIGCGPWFSAAGHDTTYAVRNLRSDATSKSGDEALMHRAIIRPASGLEVDHRDGNGLNNQRHNLRVATHAQNQQNQGPNRRNTSGYKGVHKHQNKWEAKISVDNARIYLGVFNTPQEAALAYNAAALDYHGEFARLNEV